MLFVSRAERVLIRAGRAVPYPHLNDREGSGVGRIVVGPPRHGKLSICSARPCVAPKRALIDRTPRVIPQPQQNPLGPGDCAPTRLPPSAPWPGTRHSRHVHPSCHARSCTARWLCDMCWYQKRAKQNRAANQQPIKGCRIASTKGCKVEQYRGADWLQPRL
jgi:hypothetical protein